MLLINCQYNTINNRCMHNSTNICKRNDRMGCLLAGMPNMYMYMYRQCCHNDINCTYDCRDAVSAHIGVSNQSTKANRQSICQASNGRVDPSLSLSLHLSRSIDQYDCLQLECSQEQSKGEQSLIRVNKSDAPQNMPFFPTDQRPNSRGQSAQRDLACDVHEDDMNGWEVAAKPVPQTGLIG